VVTAIYSDVFII